MLCYPGMANVMMWGTGNAKTVCSTTTHNHLQTDSWSPEVPKHCKMVKVPEVPKHCKMVKSI